MKLFPEVLHNTIFSFPFKGRFVFSAVLLFSLHASASSQVVIHPTKENIPVSSDSRFELRHEVDGADFWKWDSSDVVEIGVNEGDYSQMLGFVWDLKTDGNGTIYYFDIIHKEVRAYDYKGDWIANVGSSGTGPGELQSPLGMTIFPDRNQVIIADQFINHVFERTDSSFVLAATQWPEYPSMNGRMCAMNGHYYLISYSTKAPTERKIVHKYTLDGTWVTSFGEAYDYDDPFPVRSFANDTFIACNSEHQTVALVANHIPAMTGYSDQGEILWQITFPDYRSVGYKQYRKDGKTYIAVNHEVDGSMFLALFSDGEYFYVVYAFLEKPSRFSFGPKELSDSHAFRVHAQTGLGIYLGAAGPRIGEILRGIDGAYRFTTTENLGFPQIRIHKSQ